MRIRKLLTGYFFERNWHYTLNRRIRRRGWDLRPWPNQMALFGFNPELQDLISQTSIEEKRDLGLLLEGAARIIKAEGKLFSQLCQEALVAAHTARVGSPFYLEIGAFHPEKYSNTASLRKFLNWDGMSVDPSSESYEAFRQAGLGDTFLNVGVGPVSGVAHLHSEGAFSKTYEQEGSETTKIEILGIRELIALNIDVHYISLDIEGGELEIVKAFPWELCKPIVFTIEHNGDLYMKHNLQELMLSQGYRVVLNSISSFESWFVLA